MIIKFKANHTMTTNSLRRILLVDDEKDSGYVFELMLKMEGYVVDTFSDPIKALSSFKLGYYDLIILDYRMSGLNGLGFIQNVRKIDALAKAILVTAWEQQSFGNEVQKWFIKILGKPVSEEVLMQEVKLALNEIYRLYAKYLLNWGE
jgi:CheY-like chemotaxis protein